MPGGQVDIARLGLKRQVGDEIRVEFLRGELVLSRAYSATESSRHT